MSHLHVMIGRVEVSVSYEVSVSNEGMGHQKFCEVIVKPHMMVLTLCASKNHFPASLRSATSPTSQADVMIRHSSDQLRLQAIGDDSQGGLELLQLPRYRRGK